MMRLALFLVIGLAAGSLVAGLTAPPETEEELGSTNGDQAAEPPPNEDGEPLPMTVVELDRRVVVPIISKRRTQSVLLLDLALEVPEQMAERTHRALPRLRDAFLSTLFALAAGDAFADGVARPDVLEQLRAILRSDATDVLGVDTAEVLILEALVRDVE